MPSPAGGAGSSLLTIELLRGARCLAWAGEAANAVAWQQLHASCAWATAFQSPVFFDVWARHYSPAWEPVLVVAYAQGRLAGVMPLAFRGDMITGAGAHQAEYHCWINAPSAGDFAAQALALVQRTFAGARIVLRYLPPGLAARTVDDLAAREPRIVVTRGHPWAFIDLGGDAVDDALRKKSNKSKLNRLKREGAVVERDLSLAEFRQHLDDIAAWYDLRQGGTNDACPFQDDPSKRAFHLDWLTTAGEQLHVSGLFVGAKIVSALIFVRSHDVMHLAIAAHAPSYAVHSVSKLHLYLAARAVAARGTLTIDMTPGGRWKSRFATRTEDGSELTVYPTRTQAMSVAVPRALRRITLDTAAYFGVSRERLRSLSDAVTERLRALRGLSGKTTRFLLLRRAAGAPPEAAAVKTDAYADVIAWASARHPGERTAILSFALEQAERGATLFSKVDSGGSLVGVWLARQAQSISFGRKTVPLREPAAALSDVGTPVLHASVPDLTVLRAALAAAPTEPAYVAVSASDANARAAFHELGFRAADAAGDRGHRESSLDVP